MLCTQIICKIDTKIKTIVNVKKWALHQKENTASGSGQHSEDIIKDEKVLIGVGQKVSKKSATTLH